MSDCNIFHCKIQQNALLQKHIELSKYPKALNNANRKKQVGLFQDESKCEVKKKKRKQIDDSTKNCNFNTSINHSIQDRYHFI